MKLFLLFLIFISQTSCKQADSGSQVQDAIVETSSGHEKSIFQLRLVGQVLGLREEIKNSKEMAASVSVKVVDWDSAVQKLRSSASRNAGAVQFFENDIKDGGKNEIKAILNPQADQSYFYRRDLNNGGEVLWELAEQIAIGKWKQNFFTSKDEKIFIFQTLGEYARECGEYYGKPSPKNKCNNKPIPVVN